MIQNTVELMRDYHYELDVNSASLAKPYCLESYPPQRYISSAREKGVPLVFGSDAHNVQDLHQQYEKVYTQSK